MVELIDHVRLGRAEALRKGVELRRRQALPAEHHHLAGEKRALDFLERGVAQWRRKIDAVNLDAKSVASAVAAGIRGRLQGIHRRLRLSLPL